MIQQSNITVVLKLFFVVTPLQKFAELATHQSSGGYSNLGARGKNFQKFMLSEKKKRSDLGLDIFLPKSKCSLKKKKKGLHFNFISDFPLFLPKSMLPKQTKNAFFHARSGNEPLSYKTVIYTLKFSVFRTEWLCDALRDFKRRTRASRRTI